MSTFWYDYALQQFLSGAIDLVTANIKCALVQTSGGGTPYTPNQATDQFLSVIPAGAIAATSPNLGSKVVANGIFGAANTLFSSVAVGPALGAVVVYVDTGSSATSTLLLFLDSTYYSGLPFTPSGGNVTLSFSPTGNLIAAV